jgi:hypothetical protein
MISFTSHVDQTSSAVPHVVARRTVASRNCGITAGGITHYVAPINTRITHHRYTLPLGSAALEIRAGAISPGNLPRSFLKPCPLEASSFLEALPFEAVSPPQELI